MKEIQTGGWIYYLANDKPNYDKSKVGKWMFFFDGEDFAESMCKKAIEQSVVEECKHSDAGTGVVCFYVNDDDLEGHRHVITFFLENDLIRKTKTGKLYNLSFKHDYETDAGKYGNKLRADIKLEQFINLETGEWIK